MIDPLLRHALGYVRRAPTWAVAIALCVAAFASASVAPPLVADAAADRSFTAEVRATRGSVPGAGLDARAVTTGLRDASVVASVTHLLDELPVYGSPVAAVTPLRPYTDSFGPIPVIHKPYGGEITAVVVSIGDLTDRLGPGHDGPAGVWVPDTVADQLDLRAGDSADVFLSRPANSPFQSGPAPHVTIAGVYPTRDGVPVIPGVAVDQIPGGLPDDPVAIGRPARLLLADATTALALIAAMGDSAFITWDLPWQEPVDMEHGRIAAVAVHAADLQLRNSDAGIGGAMSESGGKLTALHSGVEAFVQRSERAAAELQPLVSSISLTGRVMAALVLAVGTWLLSRNRQREHQLSMSIGVHPARIALTTGLELAVPLVLGVAIAAATLRWQPQLIAGRGTIDHRTISAGLSKVLRSLPVAAGVVVAAAFAAVWPLEPSAASRARRVMAALHADTVVIVAAVATGAQIVTQRGSVLDSGTSLLFPLFAELAGAVVAVRGAGLIGRAVAARRARRLPARVDADGGDLLRRVRRPRALAVWLAARRAAAWSGELSTLVIVVAAGVGLFVYSTSIATNGERGVRDKAAAAGGALTTLSIASTKPLALGTRGMPTDLPARSTVAWRVTAVHVGPDLVSDLLLLDPATFADAVTWRPSFAAASLPALVRAVDVDADGSIPVVLAGNDDADYPDVGTMDLGQFLIRYRVVARIAAAPWIRERTSTMLASAPRVAGLLPVDPKVDPPLTPAGTLDRRFSPYVFADAPASSVAPAFRQVLLDDDTLNTTTTSRTPAFVAFEMSLPYLRIVGMGLLVVALVSIVVLGARRRADLAIEIAMTDRMGIGRATTAVAVAGGALLMGLIGSVVGIALAWQLVSFMLHRLDPGPSFAPAFSGGLSWPAAAVAIGVVTVVSVLGALVEVSGARRARVVEVLRAAE